MKYPNPQLAHQDPHSLSDLADGQHIVGAFSRHANMGVTHILCPLALKVAAGGTMGLPEALTNKTASRVLSLAQDGDQNMPCH